MNEFAFEYDYFIRRDGGLEKVRIFEINKEINRTPMGAIKYMYPIERLKESVSVL